MTLNHIDVVKIIAQLENAISTAGDQFAGLQVLFKLYSFGKVRTS